MATNDDGFRVALDSLFRDYYLHFIQHRVSRPVAWEDVEPMMKRAIAAKDLAWWQEVRASKAAFVRELSELVYGIIEELNRGGADVVADGAGAGGDAGAAAAPGAGRPEQPAE